jgi:hypothetical protein
MLRILAFTLLAAAPLAAQIWPEAWHGSKRADAQPVAAEDAALWTEYSGEAAERAVYSGPVGRFTATAWRLHDPTSALAWYQASRPAACTPWRGPLTRCTTPGAVWLRAANYVLLFEGWRPLDAELRELFGQLPKLKPLGSGEPLLPGYLPERGRVLNSERYLLGIHSLQKFMPAIPAAVAGFEEAPEAQAGQLVVGGKTVDYAVFDYHTPQLAWRRLREFQKQPGWAVQRSGPLVAVIPGGLDTAAAQAVVGQLSWRASYMENFPTKMPPMPNVGGMLVAIFELTGTLLVLCLGGGILFAGVWVLLRRRRMAAVGSDTELTLIPWRD